MSWAYGVDERGREIGYSIGATCDEPGCNARIDRGLAYRCGQLQRGTGCGSYFCDEHLFFGIGGYEGQRCARCRVKEEESVRVV